MEISPKTFGADIPINETFQIDGIDFILDNYTEVYLTINCGITYKNSLGKVELNNIFLAMLFENLAKYEDYYFKVKYPKWVESLKRRTCPSSDPYDKEIWNGKKSSSVENYKKQTFMETNKASY